MPKNLIPKAWTFPWGLLVLCPHSTVSQPMLWCQWKISPAERDAVMSDQEGKAITCTLLSPQYTVWRHPPLYLGSSVKVVTHPEIRIFISVNPDWHHPHRHSQSCSYCQSIIDIFHHEPCPLKSFMPTQLRRIKTGIHIKILLIMSHKET